MKAIALQPANHSLRLTLANIYTTAGDNAAARSELNRLAAIGGKFARQKEMQGLLKNL